MGKKNRASGDSSNDVEKADGAKDKLAGGSEEEEDDDNELELIESEYESDEGESGGEGENGGDVSARSRRFTLYIGTLTDYENQLQEHDIQPVKGKSKKSLRTLVSKKKKRYVDKKYDLDLAYVTDRIVAMGFPSKSVEAMYRNPMKTVQKFFNDRHPGHYKVYNLCSEKGYDSKSFPLVARFPFEDHQAPTLELMRDCVADMMSYLDEHPDNVAVVHCKAGKGRTGVMISAFLFHRYLDRGVSVDDALRFYGKRRTHDEKGVTILSQRRFVLYYATWLSEMKLDAAPLDAPRAIRRVTVRGCPKNWDKPELRIRCDSVLGQGVMWSTEDHAREMAVRNQNSRDEWVFEFISSEGLSVNKEICLELRIKDKKVFYVWMHTAFEDKSGVTFTRDDLDGKVRKKKHAKVYGPEFACAVEYVEGAGGGGEKNKKKKKKEKEGGGKEKEGGKEKANGAKKKGKK